MSSKEYCKVYASRFSESQILDDILGSVLERKTRNKFLARLSLQLPSPPVPGSSEFCQELSDLYVLRSQRDAQYEEIVCEQELSCFRFDDFYLSGAYSNRTHPNTMKLLANTIFLLDPILFDAKVSFDRVRPSFADPNLSVLIPVPRHPSYPSGHAAQARLVAEILSSLKPGRRTAYLKDAERIARNREIAGLHYKSDSDAGFVLALAFLSKLQTETWFTRLSERAKEEWAE